MNLIAATLLLVDVVLAGNLELLLLHNNDMHARFDETTSSSGTCAQADRPTCIGGFARVAHLVREAKRKQGTGRQVLFLNAGDTYTGTAWFAVHKWKIARDFLNMLDIDVMSLGNHEFDLGPEGLAPLIEGLNFPTVASNVDFSKEEVFTNITVPKSVVLEVSGRKIGIIGYLTPSTEEISKTGKVVISDEIDAIREESERLDGEGIDIIIALGHSGYSMDLKIAKEVPLVDIVVGGHTNTFLWNGPPPDTDKPEGPYPMMVTQDSGKQVPVVQAYAYTKYLGQLNVTFDEYGDLVEAYGQPILLDNSISQEKDVLELLDVYRKEVDELDKETVGSTKVYLDGDVRSCRFKECNFGNLIADAFIAYRSSVVSGKYWTDAPIALINGGAIRSSINASALGGNITRGQLLGVLPFDNQIVTLSLNGSDLVRTLEIGARSNGETSNGEFLQVSGLQVTYDYNKPAGKRVAQVRARCSTCGVPEYEDVAPDQTYRLVTTNFLSSGGDGHYVLEERGRDMVTEDISDLNIVAWYLKKRSPVFPGVFDRILFARAQSGAHSVLRKFQTLGLFAFVVLYAVS